jgi:hypothetical protein
VLRAAPTVNWVIDPIIRIASPETTFLVQLGVPPGLARFDGPGKIFTTADSHRMTSGDMLRMMNAGPGTAVAFKGCRKVKEDRPWRAASPMN